MELSSEFEFSFKKTYQIQKLKLKGQIPIPVPIPISKWDLNYIRKWKQFICISVDLSFMESDIRLSFRHATTYINIKMI